MEEINNLNNHGTQGYRHFTDIKSSYFFICKDSSFLGRGGAGALLFNDGLNSPSGFLPIGAAMRLETFSSNVMNSIICLACFFIGNYMVDYLTRRLPDNNY